MSEGAATTATIEVRRPCKGSYLYIVDGVPSYTVDRLHQFNAWRVRDREGWPLDEFRTLPLADAFIRNHAAR